MSVEGPLEPTDLALTAEILVGRRAAAPVATLPVANDEDYRYERKYFLDFVSAEEAELLVKLHPCGFRKIYPDASSTTSIWIHRPSVVTDRMRRVSPRE